MHCFSSGFMTEKNLEKYFALYFVSTVRVMQMIGQYHFKDWRGKRIEPRSMDLDYRPISILAVMLAEISTSIQKQIGDEVR